MRNVSISIIIVIIKSSMDLERAIESGCAVCSLTRMSCLQLPIGMFDTSAKILDRKKEVLVKSSMGHKIKIKSKSL